MNYVKSGLTLSAVVGVGIGAGLLARVGFGATTEVGVDVPWFDRTLAGAQGGQTPSLLTTATCEACDNPPPLVAGEHAIEALHIANDLSERTVPLLMISENAVEEIELDSVVHGTRTLLK
jgi:hypothetical protein